MTKAKEKKIKSKKKSKMDKIQEKLVEAYDPSKTRYTDEMCIDMLLHVRDACIDHLLYKTEGKINNKGVFVAHEMIERTMRNMQTIGKHAALNQGNAPKHITVVFQDDEDDTVTFEDELGQQDYKRKTLADVIEEVDDD